MADKIKKFFARKKADTKFKLAGPGRKLATDQAAGGSSKSKKDKEIYVPPKRNELSSEARAAAEAAMSRNQKKDKREFNTSLAAIQAQVRRELEAERKAKAEESSTAEAAVATKVSEKNIELKNFAVQGVFFRCPLVSDEVLPKKDWQPKIHEFLYAQLDEEKGLTASLIILNCNVKEKADACIETLTKYLENILNNPDEEKYRKIRMSNRIFCEKVKDVEGALDFLLGVGFIEQQIDEEIYLLWQADAIEGGIEQLRVYLDALHNSEVISLELDRNIQVLLPSQARRNDLPPDFYRMSTEEIKREQQLRSEVLESALVLKTKAMREREEVRTMNRYKFALIRVRFPDGIYLQGTFNVYDKLSDVYEFVQSCLKDEEMEYVLTDALGHRFGPNDLEKSMFDLRLVPNTVLTFHNEVEHNGNYLKEDLLMLIQNF